jgi:hypothetical protein
MGLFDFPAVTPASRPPLTGWGQHLGIGQFSNAGSNGAIRKPRCLRYRRNTAPAQRPRFRRRPVPPATLVQTGEDGMIFVAYPLYY